MYSKTRKRASSSGEPLLSRVARGNPNAGANNLSGRHPRPFFYKLSLANKILIATLALLVLLGALGVVGFQFVLRSYLHGEVAASTRMLAASAAEQAGPLLARSDTEALHRLMVDLQRIDETIAYAMVIDRSGNVVAHTFPWDPPAAIRGPPPAPSAVGNDGYRQVRFEGRTYLDVSAPIRTGPSGAGAVQIGIDIERVGRFVGELNLLFVGVLAGLTLLAMLAALFYFRYVTRPVMELTHLADEVSVGNLGVDFDFGVPVRCWEIKKCGHTDCVAYENTAEQCWFVDGTPCEGYEPRFPQKLVGCRTCEVYRAHKGDEIVQLYDSFRHMTHVLRKSRSELERSDRFQRSLIRNSFDGIIATDETGTVRVFNRIAQNLTGYREDEVVGKMMWNELFASELHGELRTPLFQDGSKVIFGFYRREKSLLRKDGSTVDVRASGITLREENRHVGKVFFFQDLREINKLREELIRQERLAATGQTVASISHSVKNILEGLRGGAYIYRRGARVEDPAVRMHGWLMVERNIERISSLVADLLNYARERKPDFVAIDPNQLVSDVLETQRPKAEAQGTALETQFDSAVSSWLLDPHAMHQCLTNLVTNALDATAGIDGAWVRVSTHLTAEDQLEIRIQDSGPGIAPNLLDTLFTSMISTKGSKGTGLGLLVVNKIVMEHGGKVTAEAGMAPGATFRVFLPRRAGEAEVPSLGGQVAGVQVAATGSDDAVSATGSRQVPFGLESS